MRFELPEFELTGVTAQGAAPFSKKDLLGRPWVADFIFTSCAGPCPALSLQMAALQRELPPLIGLVSFTVDPELDTPERLKSYAARFGAEPARWRFVTGSKERIHTLLQGGFKLAAAENPGAKSGERVIHSTKLALVDAQGAVVGYYGSDEAEELARLKRDALKLAR